MKIKHKSLEWHGSICESAIGNVYIDKIEKGERYCVSFSDGGDLVKTLGRFKAQTDEEAKAKAQKLVEKEFQSYVAKFLEIEG